MSVLESQVYLAVTFTVYLEIFWKYFVKDQKAYFNQTVKQSPPNWQKWENFGKSLESDKYQRSTLAILRGSKKLWKKLKRFCT